MTVPQLSESMAMDVPVVCNLSALSDLNRYRTLSNLLKAAISSQAELSDGYAYSISGGRMTLGKLGEWMEMERQCCPFLSFDLSVSGQDARWWLTLTGPEGTKAILEQMFSA